VSDILRQTQQFSAI